jgi:multiple sugar transport system substrate-binding protein
LSAVITALAAVSLLTVTVGSTTTRAAARESYYPKYPRYTKKVTITWWSWTANPQNAIKAFEKAYPSIHVIHRDVGAGPDEYNKLSVDIASHKGAPDVVQIEYENLPEFIEAGDLDNITPYVKQYQNYFPSWVWNSVSLNHKVYAMPEDIGPLAFMYRPREFTKYGLKTPTTWAIFAQDAIKLHKKDPNLSIMVPISNDGPSWFEAMMWQAGGFPFQDTAHGWVVNFTSPTIERVMNYWGGLIKDGAVLYESTAAPSYDTNLAKGVYLSAEAAAWAPHDYGPPVVKAGTQHWKAIQLPQWTAGAHASADSGGSSNAVTVQSKHPRAAALFAAWINTSEPGLTLDLTAHSKGGRGLFPGDKYRESIPAFDNPVPPLVDNQRAYETVYGPAVQGVNNKWQWPPFYEYAREQMVVQFQDAASGKETWDKALANVQSSVIQYAQSQGYSAHS